MGIRMISELHHVQGLGITLRPPPLLQVCTSLHFPSRPFTSLAIFPPPPFTSHPYALPTSLDFPFFMFFTSLKFPSGSHILGVRKDKKFLHPSQTLVRCFALIWNVQILLMQVRDILQNDFHLHGVTVHATLLPLVDGTEPKQFGQWTSISDAHGIAMFNNLDVDSKGKYKIRFWLDIMNSSSVTTSTFTGMGQK